MVIITLDIIENVAFSSPDT